MNSPQPILPGQMAPLWTPSGSHPLTGHPAGQVSGISSAPEVLPGCVGTMVPVLPDDLPHADYWRQRHASMAFAGQHGSYNDYEPAYRYGAERSRELPGASFSEQELLLSQGWREFKGDSRLLWDAARPAVRHAWNRAQPRTPANVAANCGPCGVPIDLT